jgi:hypothetical protein
MPTEAEFRTAADILRGALALVSAGRRHATAARDVDAVRSPTIGTLYDTALEVAGADLYLLGRHVQELAALCDGRARVCAEHASELHRWERRAEAWELAMLRSRGASADPASAANPPGPAPVRPVAPASWVEPG